jgi:hypothetical protein
MNLEIYCVVCELLVYTIGSLYEPGNTACGYDTGITLRVHIIVFLNNNNNNNNKPWCYSSDEPWPAEQPPLAVFPDCTRRYWVDMWSAHRIPQLSKPDCFFFIQVTTQFIPSRG